MKPPKVKTPDEPRNVAQVGKGPASSLDARPEKSTTYPAQNEINVGGTEKANVGIHQLRGGLRLPKTIESTKGCRLSDPCELPRFRTLRNQHKINSLNHREFFLR